MQITHISTNNSFSALKMSPYLTKKLAKTNVSATFIKNINNAKKIIKDNNLHKQKYIDIILGEDTYNHKIIAMISSKKQGVPMNPNYMYYIPSSKDKAGIKDLINWTKSWDYAYSPKGLKDKMTLEKKLLEAMKKIIK